MLSGDEFRLSGTSEGIRAFSDTLTGVGVIAKTAPESLPSNPHHALRVAQEHETTNRLRFQFIAKNSKTEGK